jgi:hypothetical protein
MAKHIWTVLCRRAITDRILNIVSLIDVIEEIAVASHPALSDTKWSALPLEAVLVSFWERSSAMAPELCQLRIQILSPTGEIHPQLLLSNIDLTEAMRARISLGLGGMPIHGFGTHKFVVSMRKSDNDAWGEVVQLPLDYKLLAGTEPVPAAESPPAAPKLATTKTKSPKKRSPKKGGVR